MCRYRFQRCSPRDRGIGLKRYLSVLVLILDLALKDRSRLFSRPIINLLACMRRKIIVFLRKLILKIAIFINYTKCNAYFIVSNVCLFCVSFAGSWFWHCYSLDYKADRLRPIH